MRPPTTENRRNFEPRLTAARLSAGRYRNQKTGERPHVSIVFVLTRSRDPRQKKRARRASPKSTSNTGPLTSQSSNAARESERNSRTTEKEHRRTPSIKHQPPHCAYVCALLRCCKHDKHATPSDQTTSNGHRLPEIYVSRSILPTLRTATHATHAIHLSLLSLSLSLHSLLEKGKMLKFSAIPEIFNFYCDISNRIDGREPGVTEITRTQAAHDRLHQSEKQDGCAYARENAHTQNAQFFHQRLRGRASKITSSRDNSHCRRHSKSITTGREKSNHRPENELCFEGEKSLFYGPYPDRSVA